MTVIIFSYYDNIQNKRPVSQSTQSTIVKSHKSDLRGFAFASFTKIQNNKFFFCDLFFNKIVL
jgi:hypothetical protein